MGIGAPAVSSGEDGGSRWRGEEDGSPSGDALCGSRVSVHLTLPHSRSGESQTSKTRRVNNRPHHCPTFRDKVEEMQETNNATWPSPPDGNPPPPLLRRAVRGARSSAQIVIPATLLSPPTALPPRLQPCPSPSVPVASAPPPAPSAS